MVSAAHVDICTSHNGGIDQYQRCVLPQKAVLGDSWSKIEDLRRRPFLVAVGRASPPFARSDEDARRRIRAVSKAM